MSKPKVMKAVTVVKKSSSKKPEVKVVEKAGTLVLPYYNEDFKEGGKKDVKRSLMLSYFLTTTFKSEKEVLVKDVLSACEKYKKEGVTGVAPNLSGKIRRYLLGLEKPIHLRIVELDAKTVKNSKGGDTTLITKYRITPIIN